MVDGHHGLVLQGGGALGAFELGVARAIYAERCSFRPGVIAGVSIGAITAALLGRPANGLSPLAALELFWQRVTISSLFPDFAQPYVSLFGLPGFYAPNPFWAFGTNFYDTAPLRVTLEELVDPIALADPDACPRLCFTATDIQAGQLVSFDSKDGGLTIDHILASGSLPPSFPPTEIGGRLYWDGGVFDNTPLGDVIDRLEADADDRAIMVINLFPNVMPLPRSLADVSQHFLNLLFANKTASDVRLMRKFNAVADVAADLAALREDDPVRQLASVQALLARPYRRVPHIIEVTRTTPSEQMEASDFSHDGIERRAADGYARTRAALEKGGFLSG